MTIDTHTSSFYPIMDTKQMLSMDKLEGTAITHVCKLHTTCKHYLTAGAG